MPATASANVGMTWLLLPCREAKPRKSSEKSFQCGKDQPRPGWAGRKGRHGGEAPALWGGPMMSALIL